MENNTFRGNLFGGFNRKDVVRYVEKSAKESQDIIDSFLEKEKEYESVIEQKENEISALREELTLTKEQLSESLQKSEELSKDLSSYKEIFTELDMVKSLLNECAPIVSEYNKLKDKVAAMEAGASQKAEEVQNHYESLLDSIDNPPEELNVEDATEDATMQDASFESVETNSTSSGFIQNLDNSIDSITKRFNNLYSQLKMLKDEFIK